MRHLLCLLALLLGGCGPANTSHLDAGLDTSCGFDCDAQAHYGLVVNRCYEYAATAQQPQTPPALGVWVRPLVSLEGGVKVLPVEYRQSGQIKMVDDFALSDGALVLMRREFVAEGRSVTFKRDGKLTGVRWLSRTMNSGETESTDTLAQLATESGASPPEATTYRVTAAAASASDLKTPLSSFSQGLKLLFIETPDHGSDSRRVFVPATGFVAITSPLSLSGTLAISGFLQRVRDIGSADGGSEACSLGTP